MGFFKSSIASLETQAQKAHEELAAAEAAFASAVQAMEAPPIELSDDQVGDLVSVKNLAEVRLVKARATVRRTDVALNEARSAAAEKERAEALARVLALGAEAQKIARHELAAATKGMRKAIRLMSEAENARNELNATLPRDEQIPSFENAVLERAGIPEQIIKHERILRWVNSAGQPLFSPEDEARLVENRQAGTAKLPRRPGSLDEADFVATRRRFFERKVTLPAVPAHMEGALAETVKLPGLDGGAPGWIPCHPGATAKMFAELEAMASAKPRERTPIETVTPASPVFNSTGELDSWEATNGSVAEAAA